MSTSSDQGFLIRAGITSSNKKIAPANTKRDVITNLPECVMSHILSRLPTRDAVRTSVLSKAWEFKWTSIYNIDVEEKPADSISFLEFVDRLLTHSQYTKSFRLACTVGCDPSRIKNWISSVFIRNVETVDIYASVDVDDAMEERHWFPFSIVLPRSLISCTSLKELKIVIPSILKFPATIGLPNLKSLHLHYVEILTETDTVRFNLPVLQRWELLRCCWSMNVKSVEIYAPALTSFVSRAHCFEDHQNYAKFGNYTIKIDSGVKLAHFEVSGGSFLENLLWTGSQVSTAILKVDVYVAEMFAKCESRFRKILNEFSGIQQLTISCLVAQAIAQTKWAFPLRKYDKLVRLYMHRPCRRGNHHATYDALLELLHAAPYLKFLSVGVRSVLKFSNDGAYDFDAVVSVPSCIVSHLKAVALFGLKADDRHLDLVKFLLKNGSQLKIFYALVRDEFKAEVEDVLPKLPKGSQCVFVITV